MPSFSEQSHDILTLVVDALSSPPSVLAFPFIRIIWLIRTRLAQKLVLACSLCVTVVMIPMTIIRTAGLRAPNGSVDNAWAFYNLLDHRAGACGAVPRRLTAVRPLFVAQTSSTASPA
jgi:hypothetical protein